jgi:ligand-binding SRPBCC domain-containing protein
MFRVKESIHVNAPVERCFLLATSIPLVQQILGLHPVAGQTSGLVVHGDRVVWRGWKFGLPVRHESLITEYDRPHFFQDTMVRGMFRHFQHDHRFEDIYGHTLMADVVRFSLPLGALGKLAARRILVPHILDLLHQRFRMIERIAEGPDWERYIVTAQNSPASTAIATEVSRIQEL